MVSAIVVPSFIMHVKNYIREKLMENLRMEFGIQSALKHRHLLRLALFLIRGFGRQVLMCKIFLTHLLLS